MKIGLFCDVSNLYYGVKRKYGPKARLDYTKLYEYVKALGEVHNAVAYGGRVEGSQKFIHYLETNGYDTQFKPPRKVVTKEGKVIQQANMDVEITLDIAEKMSELDVVVLGSSDSDFKQLVQSCLAHGKRVVIIGANIAQALHGTGATCVDLPGSMLR